MRNIWLGVLVLACCQAVVIATEDNNEFLPETTTRSVTITTEGTNDFLTETRSAESVTIATEEKYDLLAAARTAEKVTIATTDNNELLAKENNEFLVAARAAEVFPLLPITALQSTNERCREDSRLLLVNIRNQTTWAMQMWDATAKGSVGVHSGNVYQLGDFDECVGTLTPVRGQYCLASVTIANSDAPPVDHVEDFYDPDASIWNKIRPQSRDPSKIRRDTIHWALCVPASCSHHDIQTSVNAHLQDLSRDDKTSVTSFKVTVDAALCQTSQEHFTLTTGTLVYCAVVAVIILIVIAATLYDYFLCSNKQKKQTQNKIDGEDGASAYLLCFSLKRNMADFLNYKTSDQNIDSLHGIRVISNLMVIIGHRIGFPMSGPIQNFEFIESFDQHWITTIVYQGHLLIDIFFLMSGLLVTYVLLIQLDKRRVNPFLAIFVRYIRLTPAYAIVVFFHATLLYHVSGGPIWPKVIEPERDACLQNWWLNLLYINNYVGNDNMCVLHSWYLPCDFHFFLFAVFFVHLLHKHPKHAVALLATLIVTSCVVPFIVTWVNRQPPLLYFYLDFLAHPRAHVFFMMVYMKSHARASSYLVGIATGYLLYKTGAHRAQHTWRPRFGYLLAFLLCGATLVPAAWFYDHTWQYDALTVASYAGIHRLVWSLGVAIFIISIVYSKRSIFGAMLSLPPFVIVSKLVYSVYLVHLAVQQVQFGSQRRAVHVDVLDQARQVAADTVFSLVLALALHLVIEVPTRLIAKRFIETKPTRPAPSTITLKDFSAASQTSIVD